MKRIALMTQGEYHAAPLKSMFRALEKTAMRQDESTRYRADNVYDIVRGALVYPDIAGMIRGVQALTEDQKFIAQRIKDRFSRGKETKGGWRDAMINGFFETDDQVHKVEVQIHHEELKEVRTKSGGHKVYAQYRGTSVSLSSLSLSLLH